MLSVWTATLVAAMALPAVSQLVPTASLSLTIVLPPTSSMAPTALPAVGNTTATRASTAVDARLVAVDRVGPSIVAPIPAGSSVRSAPRLAWPVTTAVIYLLGVAWLAARMIVGWLFTARVERRATVPSEPELLARLRSQLPRAGLALEPRLLEADEIVVPATTGVFRPAVLLPAGWRTWSTETLDAVLVHELSHVARRDALTQRLSLLYRAVYWFSPLSWWLHRRLVELGEQASDEAVLAAGTDQVAYAETLLGFFAAVQSAPRLSRWHVAMASGGPERRVERILQWRASRAARLRKSVAFVIVVVIAPVAIVAAATGATFVPTELSTLPGAPEQPSSALSRQTVLTWSMRSTGPTPQAQQTSPTRPQSAEGVYLGPPGRDDLSQRQMVDFVFDLRTLPGVDIRHAVATASIYLQKMWTRADVGLDVLHVGAVHVLDSTLVTIQDFTWDRAALKAALGQVVARALGGASSNTRLKTMSEWCGGLAGFTPDAGMFRGSGIRQEFMRFVDGKAVLYFGNGVMRGMDTVPEVAEVANVCTRPPLQFFSINGATFTDVPVGFITEVVQLAGSPVTLGQIRLWSDVVAVSALNTSAKTIRALTLGAVAWPSDPTLLSPQVFVARTEEVPEKTPHTMWGRSWNLLEADAANAMSIQGATVQVGVVDVEFSDGTHWSYDLKSKGQFEPGDRPNDAPLALTPQEFAYSTRMIEAALREKKLDLLRGIVIAADVPVDDPFAAGAHRLSEPSLWAPEPEQPLVLGNDRTKPARLVEVDAIVDATGHVLRVRTAKSVDDSPGGIDQRALVLIRDTAFTPAHFPSSRFNGESVTVLVRLPVLVYY